MQTQSINKFHHAAQAFICPSHSTEFLSLSFNNMIINLIDDQVSLQIKRSCPTNIAHRTRQDSVDSPCFSSAKEGCQCNSSINFQLPLMDTCLFFNSWSCGMPNAQLVFLTMFHSCFLVYMGIVGGYALKILEVSAFYKWSLIDENFFLMLICCWIVLVMWQIYQSTSFCISSEHRESLLLGTFLHGCWLWTGTYWRGRHHFKYYM